MRAVLFIIGVSLIALILLDAFETIVLPRRVTRRFRLARLFYRATWLPWRAVARRLPGGRSREALLGVYGPLSLILLLAFWAGGLIFGFGFVHYCLRSSVSVHEGSVGLGTYLYVSGSNFFTLGLGDVVPREPVARALFVTQSGVGFGFLALVIGYVPVIYQAFSRREANISLLDARAGSPPTAAELIRRHAGELDELGQLLREWERWAADLMESHLSYPVLCYYRSQHNNQSWLTALTAVLDASALVIVGIDGASKRQAQLAFAMARHAVVDLAQVFNTPPRALILDRLPPPRLKQLRASLAASGINLADHPGADEKLSELRRMYEPYVQSLSEFLLLALPEWFLEKDVFDNWQVSAWERISGAPASPRDSAD
jgi:hypothetical protein